MPRRSLTGLVVVAGLVTALGVVLALGSFTSGASESGAAASSPVVLAAGDIGDCETEGDEATARLLERFRDATILTLGDNAYPEGTHADFQRCFHPTWGRFKARIRPSPGNHDYSTDDAEGYFDYFGEAAGDPDRGWYSFDLGTWHLVSLNSECRRVGGCETDEPQARWLADDLTRNAELCTLAYWHRPPYTSGRYGDNERDKLRMQVLWRIAYERGVDVVLVGHEHSYERFLPMDAAGNAEEAGMRLFVVGTGGGNLREYGGPPLPTTAARFSDAWGVLKLTLEPTRYRWEFVSADGASVRDAGEAECR